jgi:hypothetical protein
MADRSGLACQPQILEAKNALSSVTPARSGPSNMLLVPGKFERNREILLIDLSRSISSQGIPITNIHLR